MSGDRVTGTVKWFDEAKGYGFIERQDKMGDVFVHHTAVTNSGIVALLQPNDVVEFEVKLRPQKSCPAAINLRVL